MRALSIAATGMEAQQLNVEVISNNISNSSTTGFKASRVEFQDLLYQNINQRCDHMITNGLLEEVKLLYPFRHLKPLHTVGYTEFFEYLDGKLSLDEAISLFKQHTRNYAKRQMTWLRKETDLNWIDVHEPLEAVMNIVGS